MDSEHNQGTRAQPTVVTERFPVSGDNADYADAFEIGRSPLDKRHAERLARDGFERLPSKSRRNGMLAHQHLLGFRLGPWSSPNHIFGWQIVESLPGFLHLVAKGKRMDGHMVWRLKDERLLVTTFIKYNKPRLAAGIWAFAGRIHRNSVPGLLRLAAKVAE